MIISSINIIKSLNYYYYLILNEIFNLNSDLFKWIKGATQFKDSILTSNINKDFYYWKVFINKNSLYLNLSWFIKV
jgi:hypothetical protein